MKKNKLNVLSLICLSAVLSSTFVSANPFRQGAQQVLRAAQVLAVSTAVTAPVWTPFVAGYRSASKQVLNGKLGESQYSSSLKCIFGAYGILAAPLFILEGSQATSMVGAASAATLGTAGFCVGIPVLSYGLGSKLAHVVSNYKLVQS